MSDPEIYEDPEIFRPERFIRHGKLDTSVRDPAAFVFGFGRRHVPPMHTYLSSQRSRHGRARICPGRYFAEDALFISVACALHVFDIGPPLGDDGRPIKSEHVQSDTLASCVLSFETMSKPLTSVLQLPRGLSLHDQTKICHC